MRIVVLLSGRGSHLQNLLDAQAVGQLEGQVVGVISNRPEAAGLQRARRAGVAQTVVDHTRYSKRPDFEQNLRAAIDAFQPQLIVLAGFMRVLGNEFVEHFTGRMINVHPSLLPAYPGLHTHARALEDFATGEVTAHGASVHFVTPEVDGGPVIARRVIELRDGDTPQSLAQRLLPEEHRLMLQCVNWIGQGRVIWRNGQVCFDGKALVQPITIE